MPLRRRLSRVGTAARRAARLAISGAFRLQGTKICSKSERFREASLDQCYIRMLILFGDLTTILKHRSQI